MGPDQRTEPRLPDWLVLNRNFVLLWLAYGIAAFGDHLSEMAMLKERGGMARPDVTRIQALMTFGFFLPFVVLGPIAGWWCDRYGRKSTMIAADLLRAALVFNMAWIVGTLAGVLPAPIADLSIVLPLVVIGSLAAFFSPARQAMLPTLVRPEQLVRANAMISALGTIGAILSAIVGGMLVDMKLQHENFHINAGTFTLSAICVFGISMKRSRATAHARLQGVWEPLRDGFRYVLTHRRTLQLVLLASIYWGAAGIGISVVPAVAKLYFGENYAMAGTLRGVLAVGLATGAAVMTIVGPTLPLQLAFLLGFGAATGWVLILALSVLLKWGVVITGLCLFGMGGAGAAILVTVMATLQRFVPDSRRGRIFGVSDMSTMAAMVLTTGAIGLPNIPNLDAYVPWLLMITAAGLLLTAMLAWRDYRRHSALSPLAWWVWQWVRFLAAFWYRTSRAGVCTVPVRGAVIIAANHTSSVDPLAILATSPRRLPRFLVEEHYYRHPLAGPIIRLGRAIPVDREKPGHAPIVAALEALADGACLGVFPQGTYAAPGAPAPEAKAGVGLLALRSGAAVVPVHISGAAYEDDPMRALARRHRVRVRYGPPMRFEPGASGGDATAVTAQIMDAIRRLAPDDHAA